MKIINKIKYKYNQIIKPYIDKDLMVLFRANKELYPFKPAPDDVQLLNALTWLYVANNAVGGQGFPAKFSVGAEYGLATPYPETTGYTICTLLAILRNKPWKDFNYKIIINLIKGSYEFLLTAQLENGIFTGGRKTTKDFGKPSIFDSAQILLGLSDLYETSQKINFSFVNQGSLRVIITNTASFLSSEMEEDGSFKTTHTYLKSKRTYYARAAYSLLRAGIVLEDKRFVDKSKLKFDYVIKQQKDNGWIKNWGFEDERAVLHTIAYTLRGLIEAAIYFKEDKYALTVKNGMDFLLSYDKDNFKYPGLLPSHYYCNGEYINDLCVVGLSQIAIVIKKYSFYSNNKEYEDLFKNIVKATKRFQLRGFKNELLNGVMPASFPIDGTYQTNKLIEWGVKFFMDSLLLSMEISPQEIKG